MRELRAIAGIFNKATIQLACFLLLSCGGGSGGGSSSTGVLSASGFSGVTEIQAIGTSWVIKWDPIDRTNVTYSIYEGVEDTAGNIVINWLNPTHSTPNNTFEYTPENFYTSEKKCFGVRVTSIGGDENQNGICTIPQPLSFVGFGTTPAELENALLPGSNGEWLLSWQGVPLTGVSYNIYKGPPGNIAYDTPEEVAFNNSISIELKISRNQEVCFVVRYDYDDLIPDTNENEVCTPKADPIIFAGVKSVQTYSGNNEVTVKWDKASQEDAADEIERVVGYKVLIDNTDTVLGEVQIDDLGDPDLDFDGSEYTYTLNYTGSADTIDVMVKAFDSFSRVDENLCIAIADVGGASDPISPDDPEGCAAN